MKEVTEIRFEASGWNGENRQNPYSWEPESKTLGTFPLLTSWIEFVGTPIEASLDDCVKRSAYRDTGEADSYRELSTMRIKLSNGSGGKITTWNCSYSLRINGQIYHSVSNKASKRAKTWTDLSCRFCWSNNKNGLKSIKPKVYGDDWIRCYEKLTHVQSRMNEYMGGKNK